MRVVTSLLLVALLQRQVSGNAGDCTELQSCEGGEAVCVKCSMGDQPGDRLKTCKLMQYNSEGARFEHGYRVLKSQKDVTYSPGIDPEVKGYSCSASVRIGQLGTGKFAFVMEMWSPDNRYLGASGRISYTHALGEASVEDSVEVPMDGDIHSVEVVTPPHPGLETDTHDPQGVFYTLDQLRAMMGPGPGVKNRDQMPHHAWKKMTKPKRGVDKHPKMNRTKRSKRKPRIKRSPQKPNKTTSETTEGSYDDMSKFLDNKSTKSLDNTLTDLESHAKKLRKSHLKSHHFDYPKQDTMLTSPTELKRHGHKDRKKKEWLEQELRLIEGESHKLKDDTGRLKLKFGHKPRRRYRFHDIHDINENDKYPEIQVKRPIKLHEAYRTFSSQTGLNDMDENMDEYEDRQSFHGHGHKNPNVMKKLAKMEEDLSVLRNVLQATTLYEGGAPYGVEEIENHRELVGTKRQPYYSRPTFRHKHDEKGVMLKRLRLRKLVDAAEDDIEGPDVDRYKTNHINLGHDYGGGDDLGMSRIRLGQYQHRVKRNTKGTSRTHIPRSDHGVHTHGAAMQPVLNTNRSSNGQIRRYRQSHEVLKNIVNSNSGEQTHSRIPKQVFKIPIERNNNTKNLNQQRNGKLIVSVSRKNITSFKMSTNQLIEGGGNPIKTPPRHLINENTMNSNPNLSDKQTSREILNKTSLVKSNASGREKINGVMNNLDQPLRPLGGLGTGRPQTGIDYQTVSSPPLDLRTGLYAETVGTAGPVRNPIGLDQTPFGLTRYLNRGFNQNRLYRGNARSETAQRDNFIEQNKNNHWPDWLSDAHIFVEDHRRKWKKRHPSIPPSKNQMLINILKGVDVNNDIHKLLTKDIQRIVHRYIHNAIQRAVRKHKDIFLHDNFHRSINNNINSDIKRAFQRICHRQFQKSIHRDIKHAIHREVEHSFRVMIRKAIAKEIKNALSNTTIQKFRLRSTQKDQLKTKIPYRHQHTDETPVDERNYKTWISSKRKVSDGNNDSVQGYKETTYDTLIKHTKRNKKNSLSDKISRRKAFTNERRNENPLHGYGQAVNDKQEPLTDSTSEIHQTQILVKERDTPAQRHKRSGKRKRKPDPVSPTEVKLKKDFVKLINRLPMSPRDKHTMEVLHKEDVAWRHPMDVESAVLKIQDEEDDNVKKGKVINSVWLPNFRKRRQITQNRHNPNGISMNSNTKGKPVTPTNNKQKGSITQAMRLFVGYQLQNKNDIHGNINTGTDDKSIIQKPNVKYSKLPWSFLISRRNRPSRNDISKNGVASFDMSMNSLGEDLDNQQYRVSAGIQSPAGETDHFLRRSDKKEPPRDELARRKRAIYADEHDELYDTDVSLEEPEESQDDEINEDDPAEDMRETNNKIEVKQNGRHVPEADNVAFVPPWNVKRFRERND